MSDTFVLIYFKMINHQSFQTRFHNSVKGLPCFKKSYLRYLTKTFFVKLFISFHGFYTINIKNETYLIFKINFEFSCEVLAQYTLE